LESEGDEVAGKLGRKEKQGQERWKKCGPGEDPGSGGKIPSNARKTLINITVLTTYCM